MKTKLLFLPVFLAVTLAWAGEPYQRPIESAKKDGWVRVALDAEAQAALSGAWIGDEKGVAVPFQQVYQHDSYAQTISLENSLIGRDDKGVLTAEFILKSDAVYQTSDNAPDTVDDVSAEAAVKPAADKVEPDGKRTATLSLNVDATAPWVAEVRVERRKKGGAWLALDRSWQIYDFGSQGQKTEISVPWDASEWRLRLVPVQGKLRALRSVEATGAKAVTQPPRRVAAALSRQNDETRINLGATPLQVMGFEVELSGTVAPVDPSVRVERVVMTDPKKKEYDYVGTSGLLWRMPGLKSNSTQIELHTPTSGNVFLLKLPASVKVENVQVLVREDELIFVAEAGKNYFLHLGGLLKKAPGDLSGLQDTNEQADVPLLTLHVSGPDPFGIPFRPDWTEQLKPFLPWVVGLAVVVLALLAWRVVRQKPLDTA